MGKVKTDSHNLWKKMKNANLFAMSLLSVALATGMAGCKHRPGTTLDIPENGRPGSNSGQTTTPGAGDASANPNGISSQDIPLGNGSYSDLFTGPHTEDTSMFQADTIYFDFDSSTIKAGEDAKLQAVASYFKDNKKHEGLIIQGNCDERGTEKYNLSLGERRALAAREYLANLGVDPQRLKTITFGASKPTDPGHEESAWKKNRRDDFVLVTPK
jgi:peptidoglycan-associated lipoprotein